jgi:hypothetical protein
MIDTLVEALTEAATDDGLRRSTFAARGKTSARRGLGGQ